jgi:hypothetical protein
MYYSYVEIEYIATSFSPARTDLALKLLKEFRGVLWGQTIKVYTDHKSLTRDALGLTSDRVYHWQLRLEEFAPEIVYIKGIHNLVADAFLVWITILRSTQLASLITPPLVYQRKGKPP